MINIAAEIGIVVIKGSGGWTDKLADNYLDEKKTVKIIGAETAKEAVDFLMKEIKG